MKEKVYFIDMRANLKENLLDKLSRLIYTAGIDSTISRRDIVALKLHFGETGNIAFIHPLYVQKLVNEVKKLEAYPFLTDANTLYTGTRHNAIDHLSTAIHNGFVPSITGAPIIIADGLKGKSETKVKIDRKRFKFVYIGKEITESDAILSIAHFKGHELSGFGGTIKNLGMGCASRRGKLAQHSSFSPKIVSKKCIGCGDCTKHCSEHAIKLKTKKAEIETEKCIGCGECISTCSQQAIQIRWERSGSIFMERMVEYTEGVLLNKKKKSFFINFLTNISPSCDCYPTNDSPIVRDLGILCSIDPVAIDQASVDLVNREPALKGTCLTKNVLPGGDKFRGLYPKVNWEVQLEYAEKLKLGTRNYNLVRI